MRTLIGVLVGAIGLWFVIAAVLSLGSDEVPALGTTLLLGAALVAIGYWIAGRRRARVPPASPAPAAPDAPPSTVVAPPAAAVPPPPAPRDPLAPPDAAKGP